MYSRRDDPAPRIARPDINDTDNANTRAIALRAICVQIERVCPNGCVEAIVPPGKRSMRDCAALIMFFIKK